jgi:tetratricopeptide (TPR) repeat protein
MERTRRSMPDYRPISRPALKRSRWGADGLWGTTECSAGLYNRVQVDKAAMLRRSCITVLVFGALAWGQNPAQPGMGPGGNGSPGGNSSSAGSNPRTSNSSGTGSGGSSARRLRNPSSDLPRGEGSVEAISGRVVLSDGAEPGAAITVQRVCGSTVRGETHPDSAGRFTVPRAASNAYTPDVSRTNTGDAGACELRASLSGYRTGTWPLGNGGSNSGGDVVLLLHRVGTAPRMTVSATSLLAPKGARRAYGKGLDAVRRHDPDVAQKEFGEAVQIYPRYAAAWLELGKVYEQREHRSEARDAYARAIAADGEFLFPYDRLYRMDVKESRWKEAADASSKVLRLDPYEFPEAFYFNAVSNLELNQLDAAERSAREAAKLEGVQAEPRGNYVLGVILWRKGDLDAAQERFQDFLAAAAADGFSAGPEQASARRMLAAMKLQRIPTEAGR